MIQFELKNYATRKDTLSPTPTGYTLKAAIWFGIKDCPYAEIPLMSQIIDYSVDASKTIIQAEIECEQYCKDWISTNYPAY